MLKQDERKAVARQLHDARALARQGDKPEHGSLGADVLRKGGALRRLLRWLALALLAFLALLLVLAFRLLLGVVGFLIEAHDDVERAVFEVREGVAGIDNLRGEERRHVGLGVFRQVGALLVGELVGTNVRDPHLAQQQANLLESALVGGVELMTAQIDGAKLLGGRHVGLGIDDMLLHERQVGQAADAHHEEFLQVAPEDGDEVQALQKWNRLVGALLEHALVEVEPRQLAVLQIGCGIASCGNDLV